jgi:hypothetical protein
MTTSPDDLSAGYAETDQPGILELKAELGSQTARQILRQIKEDGFPSLSFQILDGKIYDAGISDYGEFFCSLDTARGYLENGLTINGQKGAVVVVQRFTNGAQLKWRPN